MSIKFLSGFELRNITDDGISIHATSNLGYSTTTPATTNSNYSLTHTTFSAGKYSCAINGTIAGCWIGAQIRANGTTSDMTYGLSEGSTTEYIDAGILNSEWVIRVNGSTAASSPGASLATWHRTHLQIEGLAAGSVIRLYKDGDLTSPVVQYTLTSGDVAGFPSSFGHVAFRMASQGYIDDLWVMDPNDGAGVTSPQETLSFSVQLLSPDADGSDFSFATGSFSDVDEIPFSTGDKITADAVGQIADLSFSAADSAQVLGAVKVTQRTQRTGTTAGSQAEVSIDDGTNNNAIETVTVPGDGYIRTYIADAADGAAIEVSKLNISTIQIKTVT